MAGDFIDCPACDGWTPAETGMICNLCDGEGVNWEDWPDDEFDDDELDRDPLRGGALT